MSRENVEIFREANQAFNEGGASAAKRFFADDAEFVEPPEQPGPRSARGLNAVERLFGEFREAWSEHQSVIEEIRELPPDRLLVFSIERFRGRDGVEVEAPAGAIFTFRDNKIVRWEPFWDRQRALEAAGLTG